ncbi:MAG: hypothetical protein WCP97_00475 [bacterium]
MDTITIIPYMFYSTTVIWVVIEAYRSRKINKQAISLLLAHLLGVAGMFLGEMDRVQFYYFVPLAVFGLKGIVKILKQKTIEGTR